jgi:hypothetical protein
MIRRDSHATGFDPSPFGLDALLGAALFLK